MKNYTVGKDANPYHVVGNSIKNRQLKSYEGKFMSEGRRFFGDLVFIPTVDGFIPMVKVIDGKLKKDIYYSPKSVYSGGGKNEFSNFINSNPYGYNFTLENANPNQEDGLSDYSDGYPQYSAADGGLFGRIFGKKITIESISNKDLSKEDVEKLHKSSGSKLSLGDWIKSDDAKSLLNNVSNVALSYLNKGNGGSAPVETKDDYEEPQKSEKTILGMHPLTFGIVSGVTVIVAIVGVIIYKNRS